MISPRCFHIVLSPQGIAKFTPRLPYISAEKIKCLFLIAAAPAFLRKEKANEEVFKDGDETVFFSKYFLPAGIAEIISPPSLYICRKNQRRFLPLHRPRISPKRNG
jgi:hypothetical protein